VKFVRGESDVREIIHLRHLSGRDGYLLGALTRYRISQLSPAIRCPEGVNPVILARTLLVSVGFTNMRWFERQREARSRCSCGFQFRIENLRYARLLGESVSEVAPVGGFVKQYQVDLDPNALVAYNIPLSEVVNAIKAEKRGCRRQNLRGRTTEYYIRGRGYIKKIEDIENIVLKVPKTGNAGLSEKCCQHHLGAEHPGAALPSLTAKCETVGGIVVMTLCGTHSTVI